MHPTFRILLLAAGFSFGGASSLVSTPADSTTTPVLAASVGSDRVNLRWSLCPTCDSYEVFRSTASSGPWNSIAKVRGTVVHSDTGLTSRTLYFYRVSGFKGSIEGDFSDVLQAITADTLADSSQAKKPIPR